jgi:hypothetical protein
MLQYLKSLEFINWNAPEVEEVARQLKANFNTDAFLLKHVLGMLGIQSNTAAIKCKF